MIFTTDEINKNPYLLPNMSLMFYITVDLCQDTLSVPDIIHSKKEMRHYFINYVCGISEKCGVELTGPSWKTSLKLALHDRSSKVRMYDT